MSIVHSPSARFGHGIVAFSGVYGHSVLGSGRVCHSQWTDSQLQMPSVIDGRRVLDRLPLETSDASELARGLQRVDRFDSSRVLAAITRRFIAVVAELLTTGLLCPWPAAHRFLGFVEHEMVDLVMLGLDLADHDLHVASFRGRSISVVITCVAWFLLGRLPCSSSIASRRSMSSGRSRSNRS